VANEELFDAQIEREVDAMAIYLSAKAEKTAITIKEYVQTRVILGASNDDIRKALLDDLQNNGRIFGEFRRAVKSTASGAINRTRDASYFSEFGVDIKYRWSAVLVNTCDDCLSNHNEVKTWEEWEREGLPRTGQTRCRENCHCMLIPEEYTEIEPIRRLKKK
jgi:hypothetical protein